MSISAPSETEQEPEPGKNAAIAFFQRAALAIDMCGDSTGLLNCFDSVFYNAFEQLSKPDGDSHVNQLASAVLSLLRRRLQRFTNLHVPHTALQLIAGKHPTIKLLHPSVTPEPYRLAARFILLTFKRSTIYEQIAMIPDLLSIIQVYLDLSTNSKESKENLDCSHTKPPALFSIMKNQIFSKEAHDCTTLATIFETLFCAFAALAKNSKLFRKIHAPGSADQWTLSDCLAEEQFLHVFAFIAACFSSGLNEELIIPATNRCTEDAQLGMLLLLTDFWTNAVDYAADYKAASTSTTQTPAHLKWAWARQFCIIMCTGAFSDTLKANAADVVRRMKLDYNSPELSIALLNFVEFCGPPKTRPTGIFVRPTGRVCDLNMLDLVTPCIAFFARSQYVQTHYKSMVFEMAAYFLDDAWRRWTLTQISVEKALEEGARLLTALMHKITDPSEISSELSEEMSKICVNYFITSLMSRSGDPFPLLMLLNQKSVGRITPNYVSAFLLYAVKIKSNTDQEIRFMRQMKAHLLAILPSVTIYPELEVTLSSFLSQNSPSDIAEIGCAYAAKLYSDKESLLLPCVLQRLLDTNSSCRQVAFDAVNEFTRVAVKNSFDSASFIGQEDAFNRAATILKDVVKTGLRAKDLNNGDAALLAIRVGFVALLRANGSTLTTLSCMNWAAGIQDTDSSPPRKLEESSQMVLQQFAKEKEKLVLQYISMLIDLLVWQKACDNLVDFTTLQLLFFLHNDVGVAQVCNANAIETLLLMSTCLNTKQRAAELYVQSGQNKRPKFQPHGYGADQEQAAAVLVSENILEVISVFTQSDVPLVLRCCIVRLQNDTKANITADEFIDIILEKIKSVCNPQFRVDALLFLSKVIGDCPERWTAVTETSTSGVLDAEGEYDSVAVLRASGQCVISILKHTGSSETGIKIAEVAFENVLRANANSVSSRRTKLYLYEGLAEFANLLNDQKLKRVHDSILQEIANPHTCDQASEVLFKIYEFLGPTRSEGFLNDLSLSLNSPSSAIKHSGYFMLLAVIVSMAKAINQISVAPELMSNATKTQVTPEKTAILAEKFSGVPGLIPVIFMHRYYPNPAVSAGVRRLYKHIVGHGSNIAPYTRAILDMVTRALNHSTASMRICAVHAFNELLTNPQSSTICAQIINEEACRQVWRLLDDFNEEVRLIAKRTVISLCRFGNAAIVVPLVLEAVKTSVLQISKGGHECLLSMFTPSYSTSENEENNFNRFLPFAGSISKALLDAISTHEPQMFNYLAFHAASDGISAHELEAKRASAVRDSHTMRVIEIIISKVVLANDDNAALQVINSFLEVIRNGVGLPTRCAVAASITLLPRGFHELLPKAADELLKALSLAVFDNSTAVSRAMVAAACGLIPYASRAAVKSLFGYFAKQYLGAPNENRRFVVADFHCSVTRSPSSFDRAQNLCPGLVIPMAAHGMHACNTTFGLAGDEVNSPNIQRSEALLWRKVWQAYCATDAGSICKWAREIKDFAIERSIFGTNTWAMQDRAARCLAWTLIASNNLHASAFFALVFGDTDIFETAEVTPRQRISLAKAKRLENFVGIDQATLERLIRWVVPQQHAKTDSSVALRTPSTSAMLLAVILCCVDVTGADSSSITDQVAKFLLKEAHRQEVSNNVLKRVYELLRVLTAHATDQKAIISAIEFLEGRKLEKAQEALITGVFESSIPSVSMLARHWKPLSVRAVHALLSYDTLQLNVETVTEIVKKVDFSCSQHTDLGAAALALVTYIDNILMSCKNKEMFDAILKACKEVIEVTKTEVANNLCTMTFKEVVSKHLRARQSY